VTLVAMLWLLSSAGAAEPPPDPGAASGASDGADLGSSAGGDSEPPGPADDQADTDAPPPLPFDPVRRAPTPAEAARRVTIAPPPPPPPPRDDTGDGDPDGAPPGYQELPSGVDVLAPADDEAQADGEVTVYGSRALREARQRVLDNMAAIGWEVKGRKADGTLVFGGPESWMGAALLSPDGMLSFRRRVVSFTPQVPVEGPPDSRVSHADRIVRTGEPSVGMEGGIRGPAAKRKLAGVQATVHEAVDEDIRFLRLVLAETALREVLAALPTRLLRLWNDGIPLVDGPLISTPAERRAAIVDYWASRPDTRDGRMAQEVVADFVAGMVQRSDHPFTNAEIAAARARVTERAHPLFED